MARSDEHKQIEGLLRPEESVVEGFNAVTRRTIGVMQCCVLASVVAGIAALTMGWGWFFAVYLWSLVVGTLVWWLAKRTGWQEERVVVRTDQRVVLA